MKLAACSSPPVHAGRLTILVIDDEEAIRTLLQIMLEEKGHKVLTAANGAEGLATALSQQPDIILCDVTMPGISGHEVLRILHGDYQTRHIPFIFLTGCLEKHSIRLGMAAGAVEYLMKPFRLDELAEAIEACRGRLAWFDRLPEPVVELAI